MGNPTLKSRVSQKVTGSYVNRMENTGNNCDLYFPLGFSFQTAAAELHDALDHYFSLAFFVYAQDTERLISSHARFIFRLLFSKAGS